VIDLESRTEGVDSSPLGDLARFGDRAALITRDETISYLELAARVRQTADLLGPTRRLVQISTANTVESVVAYLAALAGGHPVMLVSADQGPHADALVDSYDPDVVFAAGDDGWTLRERRTGTAHDLHPDLALLLSTSGSTGSPKLVRLSHENVRANAHSIAVALGITSRDRVATTLPMHYCYGLSVVNSHLMRGAGLVLTDLSVLDDCFWELFRSAGATTLPGVPYTFDLLERTGFADMDLPSLRYVTQAGGRLEADRVSSWVRLGRRRGWDFYVMYGQTEATARMAILPPDLALEHPYAIGAPIPGGSFRLEASGELVYSGANVMMGYATGPDDLADGGSLVELHTGDLARELPGGIYQIVGRRSRFAKLFGLRVDLDQVERLLGERGMSARCVEHAGLVHAFVTRHGDVEAARRVLVDGTGLPLHALRVGWVQEHPTTASGKTDYASLVRQARLLDRHPTSPTPGDDPVSAEELRDLYAELLGRPDATVDSSFVGLGGDSLSYVELSVRLADRLGSLPSAWHTMSLRELARPGVQPVPVRRGSLLETTVLLRALAILLIVGTHTELVTLYGGAHILLGVAGYNFARFHLSAPTRRARLRRGLGAAAQVAVPSAIWIAGVAVLTGMYQPATALLLNGLLGSNTWTVQWQFWFLEALVWTLLAVVAVLAVPAVHRFERRSPWELAMIVLGVGLLLRYALVGVEAGPTERYTPVVVLWFFALGWAAAQASRRRERFLVTLVALATVPGFFGQPEREALIVVGFALLLWLPGLRVPRALSRAVAAVAGASLFIYLTHWQVYPHLEVDHPFLAVVASVAVGLCAERLARPAMRRLARVAAQPAQQVAGQPAQQPVGTAGRQPLPSGRVGG
jgi:acyl-CoA synthetase (AMP-forming)/AMP-acid ligase II